MDHRLKTAPSMRMGTNEDPSQFMPTMHMWKSPSIPLGSDAFMPQQLGQAVQLYAPYGADSSTIITNNNSNSNSNSNSNNQFNATNNSSSGTFPAVDAGRYSNKSMEKRRTSFETQQSGAPFSGDSDMGQQQLSSSSLNRQAGMLDQTSDSAESSRSAGSASGRSVASQVGAQGDCRRFTAVQVYKATESFSEANILGHGAFGSVFKGRLLGCQVAVKRLEGGGWQGPDEYRTEVEVLSRIRHPNIVLLMGHCPEEHCVVYEYLPGGSLQDFLVPSRRRRSLTWADRVRILAEITSALVFLHHHEPPIAHRDLKPDNVLLDANNTSKLGDVGLARLVMEEDSNTTARVRGTAGYIDPEEVVTCEVSVLSDIYAFGLIALQLLLCEPNVRNVQKLLVECSNAAGSSVGGRALSISADIIMTKVDQSGGAWNPMIARQLIVMALKCADPKRVRRPDVAEELQPALQRAAEEAQAELQKQRQGLEAQLICPLSQVAMTDPVVAADGFTYERSAIETWLMMNDTSPSTGETMEHKFLTPNNGLRQLLG